MYLGMGKHLKYDMGRRRTIDNNEEVKLNDNKTKKNVVGILKTLECRQ